MESGVPRVVRLYLSHAEQYAALKALHTSHAAGSWRTGLTKAPVSLETCTRRTCLSLYTSRSWRIPNVSSLLSTLLLSVLQRSQRVLPVSFVLCPVLLLCTATATRRRTLRSSAGAHYFFTDSTLGAKREAHCCCAVFYQSCTPFVGSHDHLGAGEVQRHSWRACRDKGSLIWSPELFHASRDGKSWRQPT